MSKINKIIVENEEYEIEDASKATKVSELENDSGYLVEETDPTVPSHVKNITKEEIDNWNSGSVEIERLI